MRGWLRFLSVFIFLVLCVVTGLLAQPGDPGGDPDVPLGGIELLIAAGAAFGAKKWFDKHKKK